MTTLDKEFRQLENLFTIVIAINVKGAILHTSQLVHEHAGNHGYQEISDLVYFIKPQELLSGNDSSGIEFLFKSVNALILFDLSPNKLPVRGQLIKSEFHEEIYYLVGMPWLKKLKGMEESFDFSIRDFPVFDSQVDLLIVQDQQAMQVKMLENLAKELTQSKINEELANRSKSNLLAMISHEMKTPLTSVIGALGLLNNISTKSEDDKLLNTIKNSSETLLKLINEILSFSKLEVGDAEATYEVFNVQDIVDDLMLILGSKIKASSLNLDWHVEVPSSNYYLSDKEKIKQILLNFLSNALKYTTAGVVSIYIEEEIRNKGIVLKFSVQDTGAGMSESEKENIFKPDWVDNDMRSYNPSSDGFGLYICKQLVELLKGNIGVNSLPGLGSSFWFDLPVEYAEFENIVDSDDRAIREELDFRQKVKGKKSTAC